MSTVETPASGCSVLTPEQVEHFMKYGYVRIPGAFSAAQANEWLETLWPRLGFDRADKKTWVDEKVHMAWHRSEAVADFAPRAWGAICDLLGGPERIDTESSAWSDAFIVNLGKEMWEAQYRETAEKKDVKRGTDMMDPRDLDNWHVDGDFFVHFLDSPEQALLVIPIYTPIAPLGGGTFICPPGIEQMAKYLHNHPEGLIPVLIPDGFAPRFEPHLNWGPPVPKKNHPVGVTHNPNNEPVYMTPAPLKVPDNMDRLDYAELVGKYQPEDFVEVTGVPGDVILLHPLMPHSASRNWTRALRVITNPSVRLRAPFNFSGDNLSLVEKKTLAAIGAESLPDWKPTTERSRIIPRRIIDTDYGVRQAEESARVQAWREKLEMAKVQTVAS